MSPETQKALGNAAFAFVGTAAFPRLAHLLRWPTRLGWRGSALYIAFNAGLGMVMGAVVAPWMRRTAEELKEMRAELDAELGREATDDEWNQRLSERLGEGR